MRCFLGDFNSHVEAPFSQDRSIAMRCARQTSCQLWLDENGHQFSPHYKNDRSPLPVFRFRIGQLLMQNIRIKKGSFQQAIMSTGKASPISNIRNELRLF